MILITFIIAFFIEAVGTYISVMGLTALFGVNLIITSMAIALDAGKLIVVSIVYKHWKMLPKLMKSYAILAVIITMAITSAGAASYLSGQFQTAIIGAQEGSLKVNILKEQQAKYENRKKQIDDQIANLPPRTTVNQRLRLIAGFKAEQNRLDLQIAEIDKKLPELQVNQIGVEAKTGPILYIAKSFDIPVEKAVKWVIVLIVFVFDPLAVFLIIAGNYLLAERTKQKGRMVNSNVDEINNPISADGVSVGQAEKDQFPSDEPPKEPELYQAPQDAYELPDVLPSSITPYSADNKLAFLAVPEAEVIPEARVKRAYKKRTAEKPKAPEAVLEKPVKRVYKKRETKILPVITPKKPIPVIMPKQKKKQ